MRRFGLWLLTVLALCVCVANIADAATLTPTTITRAGVDLTATAAAQDGTKADKFLNDGVSCIYINNASGGTLTVTLTWGSGGVVDGQTPTARTVAITNGHSAIIGPFPTQFYNDSNGYMNWSYSTATSVTVAVIKPGS